MTPKTRSTLDALGRIGRSEVALPLSRTLFSNDAIQSVAHRFPDAVRLADDRLVLKGDPEAHSRLRAVLRHLYELQL